MAAKPGHGAWLTDSLRKQAETVLTENPGYGARSLARALAITQYRAEVLLKIMRDDVPIGDEHHPQQLRTRISELESALSDYQKNTSRIQLVAEAMKGEIHKLPKLKIETHTRAIQKGMDPEDVVIVISDCQIGSWVKEDQTGGLGGYTYESFVRRLDRMKNAVFSILSYMPNKVPVVHVVLAGDIVDGGRIFKGHARQTDLIVAKQVVLAYERLAHFIAWLAGMEGVQVKVSVVPGNHGRIGDKGELSPNDNFDWLTGWFLRERFELLNVKNVQFNLPDTWWMLLKVRETVFHVSHGDDFKAWSGIPFYGALRYKQRLRELIGETFRMNDNGDAADFDAIICGHHHELAFFGNIYMNGNWVGGSEFSLKNLQVGGPPYQLMLGVHDSVGVSWTRKILLADPKRKPKVPVYS